VSRCGWAWFGLLFSSSGVRPLTLGVFGAAWNGWPSVFAAFG
jgi:hypothetical protein